MSIANQHLRERRACLRTIASPGADHDRVSILSGELPNSGLIGGGQIRVDLRYIADRDLIAATTLAEYFQVAAQEPCESLEAYADLVISDLSNELVPRWIWLRLQSGGHQVIQQDSQPAWNNREILATLDFS